MKIVLKVAIVCKKCRACILQIVSKIGGITSLTFDNDKSTLTVVGEVDVVEVVGALRKTKHEVEVVMVGDEKKEAEEKKKKNEEEKKKKDEEMKKRIELLQCCRACRPHYVTVEEHSNGCIIF